MDKFFGCLGLVVWSIFLIVISVILNGWALSVLWGWFIVPVFATPTLMTLQAIGISSIANFLLARVADTKTEQDKDKTVGDKMVEGFAIVVGQPLFAVFFGWVITLFMRGG